jgi:hypothetical protein
MTQCCRESPTKQLTLGVKHLLVGFGFSDDRRVAVLVLFVLGIIIIIVIIIVGVSRRHVHDGDEV